MAAPIATMPPRTLSLVLSVARGTSARRVRHFGGVRTPRASPRNCRVDNPWHATRHVSARPREPHAAHASVSWFTPSYEPRPSPSGHRNGKWVAYGRRVGGASVASRTFATTTAASDRHDEDSMDAAPLSSTAAYSHFDGVYMKRVWLPADQPVRGVLVHAHGLNEHSKRLEEFTTPFLNAGLAVTCMDLTGHGETGVRTGLHGYFDDVSEMSVAFRDFLAESKARSVGADSDVPVFAFGYSFGGLLAVAAMLDDPHCCDGAVLHSPLVDVAPESNVHPAVVMSAKSLMSLSPVLGKLPLVAPTRGNSHHPSHAAELMAECDADPLVYTGKMRIATGLALLEACQRVRESFGSLRPPLLVQHGDADMVCSVQGSRDLVAAVRARLAHEANVAAVDGSSDGARDDADEHVTLLEYPGGHHDLLRERPHIASQAVSDMLAWLERRMEPRSTEE